MRIAVDGGGYRSAAKALRGGNEVAAQHYGTLTQKLAGYAGMAGDDCTSEEFAKQYDAAAQEAVDGLADVVDAFASLCGLTGQSHVNHRRADAAAIYGHPARDGDGLDFVRRHRRRRLASAWRPRWAPTTRTCRRSGTRSSTTSRASPGPTPTPAGCATRRRPGGPRPTTSSGSRRTATPRSPGSRPRTPPRSRSPLQAVRDLRGAVLDLAASMRSVGDACDEYAAGVDEHREIVRAIVADMAVEAGLSVVAGAVVGFFTFGGGAAAGGAIAGWRIASAAKKILAALRALEALAKAGAVARLTSVVEHVRPVRKVLERLKSGQRLRSGKSGSPAARVRTRSHRACPATRSTRRPGRPRLAPTGRGRCPTTARVRCGSDPAPPGTADSIRIMEPTDDIRTATSCSRTARISPSTWPEARRSRRAPHPDQSGRHLPDPEGLEPMSLIPTGEVIATVHWDAESSA